MSNLAKNIEKALVKNLTKAEALGVEQKKLFAQSIALYFFQNPEAIVFFVGNTEEYNDEGYSGCFASRIDPAFVKEKHQKLKPNERASSVHGGESQLKHWTNEKADLFVESRGGVAFPFDVDYGPLAPHLQIKELNMFSDAFAVGDLREWLGGKYGKPWKASDAPEILRRFNQDYFAVRAEIESQTLKDGVKAPKQRARKAL
jgi:hypothetical protein